MQHEHHIIINLITLHFHLVYSLVLVLPAAGSDLSFCSQVMHSRRRGLGAVTVNNGQHGNRGVSRCSAKAGFIFN